MEIGERHPRPEKRDLPHMRVAFDQGKLPVRARLELLIEDAEPAEALPIAGPFRAGAVASESAKEQWEVFLREGEDAGEESGVGLESKGGADDALMAYGVPVVRRLGPEKVFVAIRVIFEKVATEAALDGGHQFLREDFREEREELGHEIGGFGREQVDVQGVAPGGGIDVRGECPGELAEDFLGLFPERAKPLVAIRRFIQKGGNRGAREPAATLKVGALEGDPRAVHVELVVQLLRELRHGLADLLRGELVDGAEPFLHQRPVGHLAP